MLFFLQISKKCSQLLRWKAYVQTTAWVDLEREKGVDAFLFAGMEPISIQRDLWYHLTSIFGLQYLKFFKRLFWRRYILILKEKTSRKKRAFGFEQNLPRNSQKFQISACGTDNMAKGLFSVSEDHQNPIWSTPKKSKN